jgi:hypothetical protein
VVDFSQVFYPLFITRYLCNSPVYLVNKKNVPN